MPSVGAINPNSVDVAIIGAGPGGLSLATQIMAQKPDATVWIYERYPEYQRHHTLQLVRSSFNGFPKTPEIQNVVNSFFDQERAKFKKISSSLVSPKASVKTSTIEDRLLTLAKAQNVHFVYETIDDPEEVARRHPNARFICHLDSSHSEGRKQIFTQKMYLHQDELAFILNFLQERDPTLTLDILKDQLKKYKIDFKESDAGDLEGIEKMSKELRERHKNMATKDFIKLSLKRLSHEVVPHQEDFQYVAEYKYEVKGKATPLSLREVYQGQVSTEAIVTEHIGKMIDGVTPITLRVLIKATDFKTLEKKATFRKPLSLDDANVPSRINQIFSDWLEFREGKKSPSPFSQAPVSHENKEERQKQKLTVTRLQVYYADEVVKVHNGRTHVISSDAAGGVPFFRTFNGIGLPGTSQLATDIVKDLRAQEAIPARQSKLWRTVSWIWSKISWLFPTSWTTPATPLATYSNLHRKLVADEIIWARGKNTLLNGYKSYLTAAHSSKVAFAGSVVAFSKAQKFAQKLLSASSLEDTAGDQ